MVLVQIRLAAGLGKTVAGLLCLFVCVVLVGFRRVSVWVRIWLILADFMVYFDYPTNFWFNSFRSYHLKDELKFLEEIEVLGIDFDENW